MALVLISLGHIPSAHAATPSGPLATSGIAEAQPGGTGILWLDPTTGIPVAVLDGSTLRMPGIRQPAVVQTRASTLANGLPRLRVADVLPEFWAQPAVWMRFLKGPDAYAGQEVERTPDDAAGRVFTDRRAWAYDPGLLRRRTSNPTTGPGLDFIHASLIDGSLVISWTGRAGWRYTIESSASLSNPFLASTRMVATDDGLQQIRVRIIDGIAFFRVVETSP